MTAPSVDHDKIRRELCVRVFQQPNRLSVAARLLDAAPLKSKPHSHPELMQMDLALHCGGTVLCDGRTVAVKPVSAFTFYPDAEHAHELKIIGADTEVLTLKLDVDTDWPAIRERSFATISQMPANAPLLIRAFRRLAWLAATGRRTALPSLTALAELLSLWPGGGEERQLSGDFVESHGKLDHVLKLIDQSLSAPPDIEEMAQVASLSPRQLSRQFVSTMGCTPHEYVTGQRLARAKEMLASGQMNVTEVAEALGFPTIHGFSRWFLRETRMNPSEFRDQPSAL